MENIEIGKHGFKGACLNWPSETVSVSFFVVQKKASGKGLKHAPIHYRLKGRAENKEALLLKAKEIVELLDCGWRPEKKSQTL